MSGPSIEIWVRSVLWSLCSTLWGRVKVLPTFATLADEFNRAITRFLREATKRHGVAVSQIGRSRIFEGKETIIVRPSGTHDETKMFRQSVELRIPVDEARSLSLQSLLERIDDVAKEMAAKQEKHLFATISESLAGTPNTLDAKGRKLSPELFYEMVDAIQIDFNSDGTPRMPTIYISPAQADNVKAVIAQAEADHAFKKRFDQLMAKKKEQWRVREASRQLVG